GILNRPWLSVDISPTVKLRLRSRLCARLLGRKFRRSAADCTRLRVSSRNCPRPLRAFETVLTLTPATRATSQMVEGHLNSMCRSCLAAIGTLGTDRPQRSTEWPRNATENLFCRLNSPVIAKKIRAITEAVFNLRKPQRGILSLLASGFSPVYPCHVS